MPALYRAMTSYAFTDFSGGDYGDIGGDRAAPNQFKATNMIVSSDGGLVPRIGLSDITPAGMPVGKVVMLVPTTTPGRDIMFIVGNTVYTFDKTAPGSGVTTIGTLAVTPTLAVYAKQGTAEFYVAIPGDKTYKLDPVAPAVTALTGSPSGSEVEVYGQRLIVVDDGTKYRIKFSEAADFNTWPPGNFIDIGDNWQITSVREQRNHLAIFKRDGVYILTGVPGTGSTVLRKADRGLGPLHPGQLDIDESDMLYYIPAFNTNPASFDGATVRQISYLKELSTARDGDTPVLPLVLGTAESIGDRTPSTVVMAQGSGVNRLLVFQNGVWTKHTTSVTISGMVRGGETGDFYITDGGAAGVAGKIYSTQFDVDRPGIASNSTAGDASTTPLSASVTLPQVWAPDHSDVQVRQVVVDFDKYNTGSASHNHFDLDVQIIGADREASVAVVTQSWDQATASAGASQGDYTSTRKVLGFKTAKGARAELTFRNVRGVKIRGVKIFFHRMPEQPVK